LKRCGNNWKSYGKNVERWECCGRYVDRDVGSYGKLKNKCERNEDDFWWNEGCEWKMEKKLR
jgi:hypothetical protein